MITLSDKQSYLFLAIFLAIQILGLYIALVFDFWIPWLMSNVFGLIWAIYYDKNRTEFEVIR